MIDLEAPTVGSLLTLPDLIQHAYGWDFKRAYAAADAVRLGRPEQYGLGSDGVWALTAYTTCLVRHVVRISIEGYRYTTSVLDPLALEHTFTELRRMRALTLLQLEAP